MTDRFRRLLDHLEWANERALGAVRGEARNERALELLTHVLASERVWIERIRSGDSHGMDIWPASSLAECEERMRENLRALRALLEAASEEDLRRPIRYENSSGTEFRTPLDEILLHVMLHGTYHRGQIARAVRESGSEPVNTDFITFARERPAS